MNATRQKRKPVFDPTALDDLDDMWPAPSPAAQQTPTAPTAAPPAAPNPVPAAEQERIASLEVAPALSPATSSDRPSALNEPAPKATPVAESAESAAVGEQPRRHLNTAAPTSKAVAKRTRPPEVLLSAEVYEELYRVQMAEKKVRRGLARPMGTIVLDAIEAHASALATTWSDERPSVGEGQLFERMSSNAVPRRRRHATAPRTVVLSGVTAGNGQRLDDLVLTWGAGTRSALVEQALRYQFGLLPD
jgi:hypothetical protein